MIQTRTAETEIRYTNVGWLRFHACAKDFGIPTIDVQPQQLVDWMIDHQSHWKPATWRLYKSSVALVFKKYYPDDVDALRRLMSATQSRCKRKGISTSDKKIKELPPDDMETIALHLDRSGSKYRDALKHFLLASTMTAVRPSEWRLARLVNARGRQLLIVLNAKNSNGRGLGPTRRIWLDDFPPNFVSIISRWLEIAKSHQSRRAYTKLMDALSELLRRANIAIWPKRKKHYTLYSCRHQGAANAKMFGGLK